MLAELIPLWDILQRNIEVELEFITRWFHSQIFHKLGSQPMYEKVQGENENRSAYIPDFLINLYKPRVQIVKSHKSFLWILASKPRS